MRHGCLPPALHRWSPAHKRNRRDSRRFRLCCAVSAIFLGQLHQLRIFLQNVAVAAPSVGYQTVGAILYAAVQIDEVSAAVAAQRIQRAVAEQAVEILRMLRLVAGEELAGLVLGEGLLALLWLFAVNVSHFTVLLYKCFCGFHIGCGAMVTSSPPCAAPPTPPAPHADAPPANGWSGRQRGSWPSRAARPDGGGYVP